MGYARRVQEYVTRLYERSSNFVSDARYGIEAFVSTYTPRLAAPGVGSLETIYFAETTARPKNHPALDKKDKVIDKPRIKIPKIPRVPPKKARQHNWRIY